MIASWHESQCHALHCSENFPGNCWKFLETNALKSQPIQLFEAPKIFPISKMEKKISRWSTIDCGQKVKPSNKQTFPSSWTVRRAFRKVFSGERHRYSLNHSIVRSFCPQRQSRSPGRRQIHSYKSEASFRIKWDPTALFAIRETPGRWPGHRNRHLHRYVQDFRAWIFKIHSKSRPNFVFKIQGKFNSSGKCVTRVQVRRSILRHSLRRMLLEHGIDWGEALRQYSEKVDQERIECHWWRQSRTKKAGSHSSLAQGKFSVFSFVALTILWPSSIDPHRYRSVDGGHQNHPLTAFSRSLIALVLFSNSVRLNSRGAMMKL